MRKDNYKRSVPTKPLVPYTLCLVPLFSYFLFISPIINAQTDSVRCNGPRMIPGEKFSREDLIRSQRELANLQFFNQETISKKTDPIGADGRPLSLKTKESSDQLELSAGWGGGHGPQTGVTFNNFSINKILGNKRWDPMDSSRRKFLRDTTRQFRLTPQQKKKRIWIVGTGNVIGYSTAMIGLYSAWYKDYPQTHFHSFNDMKEWKQVDKVGHLYSAYVESRGSMELWRWTGIERKKRIWIGGMSGAFYQTVIEVLDGFSAEWGWSWADFSANILGSGVLVAQELAWNDQRIKLKFSFHRKTYSDPALDQRSDVLFGKGSAERFLKDYNGQTYWASISLKPFLKNSKLPGWLSLAIGYGAEGMFGGTENTSKDTNGNITFNRPDIKRYRQWYLAPDIDLSKIKTKSKAVNFLLTFLSAFKFPMPSIEFSNGKFKAHAIHF